jgi:hypothetical protein
LEPYNHDSGIMDSVTTLLPAIIYGMFIFAAVLMSNAQMAWSVGISTFEMPDFKNDI